MKLAGRVQILAKTVVLFALLYLRKSPNSSTLSAMSKIKIVGLTGFSSLVGTTSLERRILNLKQWKKQITPLLF